MIRNGPRFSPAQAEAEFLRLLREPDPQALDVAQDLALEYGLHIDEISEREFAKWLPRRASRTAATFTGRRGVFVLDGVGGADDGWGVISGERHRGLTCVYWFANQHTGGPWRDSFDVWLDGQHLDHSFIGPGYRTKDQATLNAVRFAWFIVRVTRSLLATGTATIEDVRQRLLDSPDQPFADDLVSVPVPRPQAKSPKHMRAPRRVRRT